MQIIYHIITFSGTVGFLYSQGKTDDRMRRASTLPIYNLRIENNKIFDGEILIAELKDSLANFKTNLWHCNFKSGKFPQGCDADPVYATDVKFKVEIGKSEDEPKNQIIKLSELSKIYVKHLEEQGFNVNITLDPNGNPLFINTWLKDIIVSKININGKVE